MEPSVLDPARVLSDAYQSHAGPLFRHCCFRLFNREDAEEIVQETFMRAWEYLSQGKKVENLRLFLYRIANNLIIDEARKKKVRQPDLSLDRLMEEGFDIVGQLRVELPERRLDIGKVLRALRSMKKGYYDILIMRYIDGIRPQEIAVITGLSPNTVSVRLHRGIRQLTFTVRGR